jgi:hypothetical protein
MHLLICDDLREEGSGSGGRVVEQALVVAVGAVRSRKSR